MFGYKKKAAIRNAKGRYKSGLQRVFHRTLQSRGLALPRFNPVTGKRLEWQFIVKYKQIYDPCSGRLELNHRDYYYYAEGEKFPYFIMVHALADSFSYKGRTYPLCKIK